MRHLHVFRESACQSKSRVWKAGREPKRIRLHRSHFEVFHTVEKKRHDQNHKTGEQDRRHNRLHVNLHAPRLSGFFVKHHRRQQKQTHRAKERECLIANVKTQQKWSKQLLGISDANKNTGRLKPLDDLQQATGELEDMMSAKP